jgi:hypothetical protein
VLGAIVGSGKHRSDEEKALLGRKEIQPGQLVFKNRFSPSAYFLDSFEKDGLNGEL